MPYFIFRLSGNAQSVELVDTVDAFQPAKQRARDLRQQLSDEGSSDIIQMMFGEKMEDAKRLVRTKHKPSSPVEEWEA